MKNNRFVAMVLTPAMSLLLLFIIVPIVGSFVIAMFDYNPLREVNLFLGFDNYARLFNEPLYLKSLGNTLTFVLITVAVNIMLTLVLAQIISSIKKKALRNTFLVMIFMACVAPLSNSAVVWMRSVYPTKDGLLNMILTRLGVPAINWVGSANNVMLALILFTLWADIGYNTVLFTAGIDGIPRDFYEAADIDGAGPIGRFFNITLPLLGRTFSFVAAMTLISHFQMFAQFEILAREGGPAKAGQVLTTYIYYIGFKAKDMGFSAAISVSLFFLILIVTIFQQWLNRVDWGY